MARLLVTGASGMTGSEVTWRSRRRGWQALGLSHNELDIRDAEAVSNAIRDFAPNVVVNAAAYTAVDRAESEAELATEINALGAGNVARAARDAGAAIIHISTDYVFPGDSSTPYLPDDVVGPQSVYGQTKLSGEEAVREANANHCIVRTSWVFSGVGTNFVLTMLRLARERDEIRVVADQRGRPTYAGDLAEALLVAANKLSTRREGSGTYHFANEGETTWFEFARSIFDMRPSPTPKLTPINSSEYPTAAYRPRYSVLDTTSFTKTFGVTPRHWREPLRDILRAA